MKPQKVSKIPKKKPIKVALSHGRRKSGVLKILEIIWKNVF